MERAPFAGGVRRGHSERINWHVYVMERYLQAQHESYTWGNNQHVRAALLASQIHSQIPHMLSPKSLTYGDSDFDFDFASHEWSCSEGEYYR